MFANCRAFIIGKQFPLSQGLFHCLAIEFLGCFFCQSPHQFAHCPANFGCIAFQSVCHNQRGKSSSTKFVSDLRVVYEIQSRMNEGDQNPAMREETIPQSSPKKEPGRTDNTNPSTPKQQNRADDISRRLEVLACEFPILSGSLVDRRVP